MNVAPCFPWPKLDLVDALARALAGFEAALRLEQAVHGLDEWPETRLQGALAEALAQAHEVEREVHYPSATARKRSARARCDFVLRARGIVKQSRLRTECPSHPGEETRSTEAGNRLIPSLRGAELVPEDALWLELKVARQRTTGGAVDPRYGEQWRRHLIADLRKLSADPRIRDAAIALVAFTEDEAQLARDLDGFERLMIRRDVVAGFRQVRTLPIVERIGHRVCGVAVWPTVQS
ncbi:MAG: hypothetical protein F9K40_03670 [Kofleriaceae bacterium]|nr:MAG: hypothetical protein F9K40_03670 [Kofleriaceae bacterium]MBZ0235780.1 hypothetical protein [Kofleriaceae bacterium]